MSDATQPVLALEALKKSYNIGKPNELEVLHGIDLSIKRGEFTALVGPSGSGKSTLLNLLGLLDQPTAGELYLMGQPTRAMDDETLTAMRSHHIGFVFQFHHLIPAFNVLDNVLMPMMIRHGRPNAEMRERALQLLDQVGLLKFTDRKPGDLSGGQQQRVAIARALMTRPDLILADEPTGNLDTQTAAGVFDVFRQFNEAYGCAVLIVTHDPRLSATCDRTITLIDGNIASDVHEPGNTAQTSKPG